jgi:hypothetical protein
MTEPKRRIDNPQELLTSDQSIFLREHQSITPMWLTDLLTNSYPEIQESSIMIILNDILASSTQVQTIQDSFGSTRRISQFPELSREHCPVAKGIIRGSKVKCQALGVPDGYQDLHSLYSQRQLAAINAGKKVRHIVQRLSKLPLEIDFRIPFININSISGLLSKKGFVPRKNTIWENKDGTRIIMHINIWGQGEEARTQCEMYIYHKNKLQMVVDLAELNRTSDDLRILTFGSNFENQATIDFVTESGQIIVFWEKERLRQYHEEKEELRVDFHISYAQRVASYIREIGSKILWPGEYNMAKILRQFSEAGLSRTVPKHNVIRDPRLFSGGLAPANIDDRNYLKQKKDPLLSDLLLYATYDPFLFLVLGYESHLLDYLPLGGLLNNEIVVGMVNNMAEELGLGGEIKINKYEDLFEEHSLLQVLSKKYKELVLTGKSPDIIKSGPLILMRVMNKYLYQFGFPVTLDYFVDLLDFTQTEWMKKMDKNRRLKHAPDGPQHELIYYKLHDGLITLSEVTNSSSG